MLLISSASNPELYLVLGFSNLGSFQFVLLSSQLLYCYHSVSCCLFLLLIPLTILNFFHVLLIIPYVTPKLFTSVFCFSLLIFLTPSIYLFWFWANILLILYWFTLSSYIFSFVFLHGVAVSAPLSLFLFLFSLSYTSFQVSYIFLSS